MVLDNNHPGEPIKNDIITISSKYIILEEVREMEVAEIIALVSGVVAIVSALFAGFVWRIAHRTMIHQALEDVQKDYRSPEMHHAIRALWQLYIQFGDNLANEYDNIRQHEDSWIFSLPNERDRIEAERVTLHYQRRLVSHFYKHLAALYVNKVIAKDVLFSIWSEVDLRIIPQILVPIENKLREVLREEPLPPLDENSNLLILYRDSKGNV